MLVAFVVAAVNMLALAAVLISMRRVVWWAVVGHDNVNRIDVLQLYPGQSCEDFGTGELESLGRSVKGAANAFV